jgi:hypothetical protein
MYHRIFLTNRITDVVESVAEIYINNYGARDAHDMFVLGALLYYADWTRGSQRPPLIEVIDRTLNSEFVRLVELDSVVLAWSGNGVETTFSYE